MKQEERNKISTAHIMECAISQYAASGCKDISVNELCRTGNISKGKLYHHYSSKEDIFNSAIEYVVSNLCSNIVDFKIDSSETMTENFSRYYKRRIDYWMDHPDHFIIIHSLKTTVPKETPGKYSHLVQKYKNALFQKSKEILDMNGQSINISENELLNILAIVYDNMFMRDMFKIVHAIKQGDDEAAMDLAGDLLSLYNRLIYALINGIFSKDESK